LRPRHHFFGQVQMEQFAMLNCIGLSIGDGACIPFAPCMKISTLKNK